MKTNEMKLKQVFIRYELWEETKCGLWVQKSGIERTQLIHKVKRFMENTDQFYQAMRRVIAEWPVSCEVNFTNANMNHIAWLGHAACCIELGIPEECTRTAWWKLTQQQRDDADKVAAHCIRIWKRNYVKTKTENQCV